MLVWIDSPHLFLYLFILTKRNKAETNKGSAGFNNGEPKFFLLVVLLSIKLLCLFFICSPDFVYSSKANVKYAN